jgi:hypothetical protein
LKAAPTGPVTLEILDSQNKLVRRYASTDKPEPVAEKTLDIPTYWIRPPRLLSAEAGAHRFIWDLHYPPPAGGGRRTYPMTAIFHDTPSEPHGPWVMPGKYLVKLTVNGQDYTQPLTVRMDPRVKTPMEELAQQFTLSMQCYDGMHQAHEAIEQVRKLRTQLRRAAEQAGDGDLGNAIESLAKKIAALEGAAVGRRGIRERPSGTPQPTMARVQGELGSILETLQGADAPPTTQAVSAATVAMQELSTLMERWNTLRSKDVKMLNERLQQAKLPPLAP